MLQILPAIFVYKQRKHVHSLKQSSKLIKSQTYRAKIATKIARVHSPLKNFEYPTRFEPRTYRGRVARSEQQTTVQRNSGQNQSFTMFTCYTRPTLCFAYLPLCVFHKKKLKLESVKCRCNYLEYSDSLVKVMMFHGRRTVHGRQRCLFIFHPRISAAPVVQVMTETSKEQRQGLSNKTMF